MSQRDHDLMESVAADDQAITVPASSPRRDSMEDADPSLTRKRPRLDDGTMDHRDVSADPVSRDVAAAPPPEPQAEQVEMTIRSQPPSSSLPTDDVDDASSVSSAHDICTHEGPRLAAESKNTMPSANNDAFVDSPVIVAVRDDSEEVIDDFAGIQVDYDEDTYFRRFPFVEYNDGDPVLAIRAVTQHFQGANPLEGSALPKVALWLDNFPRSCRSITAFVDQAQFWDEFAGLANKVLMRRFSFGDAFCDDGQTEEEIFYSFLRSYLRMCSRLLKVDAEMLLECEGNYVLPIVSQKHLRHLHLMFRPERCAIFHILTKEYGVDSSRMGQRLLCDFIRANGIQNLLQFASAAHDKVPTTIQGWIATWTTQVLSQLGWLSIELADDSLIDISQYSRDVLRYFRKYNEDLQTPSKDVDIGVTKDLILYFSTLLYAVCTWDTSLAAELVEEFLDFGDPTSPTTLSGKDAQTLGGHERFCGDPRAFPALVTNAWKFKLLRKYVVKGRMEFRVMSIGTMDTALVEIWREHNTTESGVNHPVMQYLAEFLLHQRVVDYIISVDSHPQIISRSGNIVGFLVVTHRYSTRQTDAIWNTVCNGQDHRVVSATMTMIRGIVGLMDSRDQLYLCTKLYDLPIETYSMDIARFLRELTLKLQQRYVDWPNTDLKARPWNTCVRLLQDTSPGRNSNNSTTALHLEAYEQLRLVSSCVSQEERYRIYNECDALVAARSPKATGSVRAMHTLASLDPSNDAGFFTQNLGVTRNLIEETCAFVETETKVGFNASTVNALQCRLDMLFTLICRATEAIPADLYERTWDHLVGKHAQTNQLRDLAWAKLHDAARFSPKNEFCQQLISAYVPRLEPKYYTHGFFDFVAAYRFTASKEQISTVDGDQKVLQIRGAELLWPMLLSAPPQTIEDKCARLLASRYLEIDMGQDVKVEELEAAHVALVERCIKQLLSAYKILRSKAIECANVEDGMEIALPDWARQENELRFARTILFQKVMLVHIRNKPEFCRSRRSDSKIEVLEDLPFGNEMEIPYQYQAATKQERGSVSMNADHTLHDLYRRLCFATGFSKINLFAMGQRLNLSEKGDQKIEDLGLSGTQVLVQKAPGSGETQPIVDKSSNYSVFEATLLSHWEELFACMDTDDHISSVLFDFLTCLPLREQIADSVMSGEASADDLFPPGKVFQAKYAILSLQQKLREQLRRGNLNETFLENAVQLLDEAIRNPALLSASLTSPPELPLAAHLITVLLEFLKERPGLETSSRYFSDEASLVDRLIKILSVALKSEAESSMVALNSYSTILEASLHSRGVWEAFMGNPNVVALHKTLLLTDPRRTLRENVAQSIASVCGGDLPSTSPLNRAETASRFWTILSSILSDAVHYPGQCKELFDIAEHVFRGHDEHNRDEESLRLYLATWGDLLLQYSHQEIVGRDEIDSVVMGFTKLLLCCIPSLKSFKKPLNGGSLMERVFNKFLFIPQVSEDGPASENVVLPVLESKTRKELYDLILALAEDRSSYNTLLVLIESVLDDGGLDTARQFYTIDRTNEIRSATGYVGLVNPRAICYMNSLLTQLFMNLNFRKFMLDLNITENVGSQRLLLETQKLFAQMQNTYRKATDPRSFAACVKGIQGQPIDVNVQMDADEFYNLLFDQWEGQMVSPEIKQRFRSFYGGQTVNQIRSKECEHVSERVESFFVVQCDVKGKANLQESLQAFVEGDVMEGDNKYKCESCDGRFVDAVKRTCLKDVPDNLIFHLKRFDFDLVEMRRSKINERFEFPSYIDVSLYKADYLSNPTKPRQEDIFELVGVLVHQGTSENGHYYSYIRERPCPSGNMTKWVEFNDRDVDPFDHQSIPNNAFGGCFENEYPRQQKQFSAYMLFYQRQSSIEKDRHEYTGSSRCGTAKVSVPHGLKEEISSDNESIIKEYSLCDPNHSKFVRQALTALRTVNHGTCSEDHQQEARALHAVLEHLCRIISRLRMPDNFDETISQLRKTMLSCSTCCHISLKWMASHQYALVNLLLRCIHSKVRSQARALLIDSLQFLRDKDPALYGLETVDTDMETGNMAPIEGVLVDITQRLRLVAEESWISSKGWDDLYLTLCQLSNLGRVETATLLNQGFLEFCLALFCMHAHYSLRVNEPDLWRVIEKKKGIFNRMIELVFTLVSKMDIRLPSVLSQDSDRLEFYDRTIAKFPLSLKERQLLMYWHEDNKAIAVLDKFIELFDNTRTTTFYPGLILKWMLQSEDSPTQEMVFITVLEGIQMLTSPSCDPYVRAALPFCEACPDKVRVSRMVDAVAKSATELRESGGDTHLDFFASLSMAENEIAFGQVEASDMFFALTLAAARKCAISLLLYDDDGVRKTTEIFLKNLFNRHKLDEVTHEGVLLEEYRTLRILVPDMSRKVIEEHANGTSRNYMQPMIGALHELAGLFIQFWNSEEPVLAHIKQPSDAGIIQKWQTEVNQHITLWPFDEGTPISTGDAYEQSDYGSESDDGPDILDS